MMMKYALLFTFLSLTSFAKEITPEPKVKVEEVLCPRVGELFVSSGKKSLSSMEDLIVSLIDQRQKQKEFYIKLMSMKKEKPEHELAAAQIKEINQGASQKLSRAKENYNREITSLAEYLPQAKKCWSYHPKEYKEDIGRLIEIFNKEKILTNYKACINLLTEGNKFYQSQFLLSIKLFNKEISQYRFVTETKKEDIKISKYTKMESVACNDFLNTDGLYYGYLNLNLTKREKKKSPNKKFTPDWSVPKAPGFGF